MCENSREVRGSCATADACGDAETLGLLLARVALGDSDAFAAVYDQVAGTVYSLVPPGTVSAWIRDGLPRLRASAE